MDWPELVHRSMTVYVAQGAEPVRKATAEVTGAKPSLDSLLNAVDLGVGWEIADRLPKSEEAEAATGRAAREFARPVLYRGLRGLVVCELIARGDARFELSWSGPAELRLAAGYDDGLDAALEAAVDDRPDTARSARSSPRSRLNHGVAALAAAPCRHAPPRARTHHRVRTQHPCTRPRTTACRTHHSVHQEPAPPRTREHAPPVRRGSHRPTARTAPRHEPPRGTNRPRAARPRAVHGAQPQPPRPTPPPRSL